MCGGRGRRGRAAGVHACRRGRLRSVDFEPGFNKGTDVRVWGHTTKLDGKGAAYVEYMFHVSFDGRSWCTARRYRDCYVVRRATQP